MSAIGRFHSIKSRKIRRILRKLEDYFWILSPILRDYKATLRDVSNKILVGFILRKKVLIIFPPTVFFCTLKIWGNSKTTLDKWRDSVYWENSTTLWTNGKIQYILTKCYKRATVDSLPGKSEYLKMIKNCELMKRRNWSNIKDYVQNHKKKNGSIL